MTAVVQPIGGINYANNIPLPSAPAGRGWGLGSQGNTKDTTMILR